VIGPRVDANVIIRFLTDEPRDQAERAAHLFDEVARGENVLVLEEVVLAEVVWTLASFYGMPRADISAGLLDLVASDGILAEDKDALRVALVLFSERSIDFADTLLAAKALLSGDLIYSFDRDVDRIPGVVRREP
jgi:uncharacterized protein